MITSKNLDTRRQVLPNARTSVIVWEDMAEMKKQGLEDAAYR